MAMAFLVPQKQAQQKLWLPQRELITAAPALSDVEEAKLQLGQSFAAVRQITESCTAIRNTRFSYPGTPPDWFIQLNQKLDVSKKLAAQWLDDYSVAVSATIPMSVLNFVPTFDASAQALQVIIDRNPGELSPSDLTAAKSILLRLMNKVDEIAATVKTYAYIQDGKSKGKLIDWQNDMRSSNEALQDGSASIQKAHQELAREIDQYNNTIMTLRVAIEYYNKLVALGAGLVGGGALVGVLGFGFVFDFPVLGGIALALGIGMIIGGAVTWGVMQSKINKANDEIAQARRKIAEDKQTIVALDTLNDASRLALQSTASAVANMSDLAATWMLFSGALRHTYIALQEGGQSALSILIGMQLAEARKYWAQTAQYAEELLQVPKKLKELPASSQAA